MKKIIHCKQLLTIVTNDLKEKFLLLALYKTNLTKNETNLTFKQKQYHNNEIMKIINEIKFLSILEEELLMTKINSLPLVAEPTVNYNYEYFHLLMRTQCLTSSFFIELFTMIITTFLTCIACPILIIYALTIFCIHTFTRTLPIIPFLFKKMYFSIKKRFIKWRNLRHNYKNKSYKNDNLFKLLKLHKCNPNHYYNWKKQYFANLQHSSQSLPRTSSTTSNNDFNPELINDNNIHNTQCQPSPPKLLVHL